MNSKFRSLLIGCSLLFTLTGCSNEESISSSGGGASGGDGGAQSSIYAGTYKGAMDVEYKGDGINGSDSIDTTIVIHDNGTVTMTIDGESVNGVINGSKLTIEFTVTKSEDGITCKGDAIVKASVAGSSVSGPVSGDAECKLLLLERNATLTGTLNARKV